MKKFSPTLQLITIVLFLLSTNSIIAQKQNAMSQFEFYGKGSAKFPNYNYSNDLKKLGKKTIKQRLDSMESEQYDSASNTWNKEERTIYEYDNKGNTVLMIDISWDDSLQRMKNQRKSVYAFDINKNQILVEEYNWNEANKAWIFVYKDESVFDNTNNILSRIGYHINNNLPEVTYKTNYIYTNNKLEYFVDSNYDKFTNKWTINSRINYTHNASGNIISAIVIWWDKVNNTWTNSGKTSYTYDANNNITSRIYYSWSANDWEPNNKTENTFDKDNNNISQIESNWNSTDQIWRSSYKDLNVYNGDGDLTQRIYSKWNPTLSNWEIQSNIIFSFNTAYSKNDLIGPLFFDGYKHMPTSYLLQQFEDGILIANERGTAYYSSVNINGLNAVENIPINIFPNPTNGLVNVDFKTNTKVLNVTITDISGKVIKHLNYENIITLQFNISDLSAGIYFLNLETNDKNTVYKIIKNE